MYDVRVCVCECGWEADVVHMFKIVNVCVCVCVCWPISSVLVDMSVGSLLPARRFKSTSVYGRRSLS